MAAIHKVKKKKAFLFKHTFTNLISLCKILRPVYLRKVVKQVIT